MTSFPVKDMTCGHCVSPITKAVKAVDQVAKVQIDLATNRVTTDPTEASVERVAFEAAPSRAGGCCD